MDPKAGNLRTLVRGLLGLGMLLAIGWVLTRSNPNAGLFLFLAVVCFGLVVVSLFASGVQRFGGTMLQRTGRSERDFLTGGLLLIALLTPWSVSIPTLQFAQLFGWQSPAALITVAALLAVRIRPVRRLALPAIVVAGLAILGWLVWVSAQLQTPAFSRSGFPFLPIDLLGEGWYIGLAALAITVDGAAAGAASDERPARPAEVWPYAVIPGLGLVRMQYPVRGRIWLLAVAFGVVLIQANAVSPSEFQYFGSFLGLPQPRLRGAVLIPTVLAALVWLGSLWDTWMKLRLEQAATDSLLVPLRRRDSSTV